MGDGCSRDHSLFNFFRLTGEQFDDYRQQGYLALGRTLTDDGLAALRGGAAPAGGGEVLQKYYAAGPLVDIAQQAIGANATGATMQLAIKRRGDDTPSRWHRDDALVFLTALDDMDEHTGCIRLVPGSHMQTTSAAAADESQAVTLSLHAGECLMLHGHVLHRCDGNRSTDRDRRLVHVRYVAGGSPAQ